MPLMHNHHIVPKHAGGTNDPSNLMRVTIPEHAEAHRVLWETTGSIKDKMAWLMLSGKTEEGEAALLEILRSPEVRAKHTGSKHSSETRAEMSRSRIGHSVSLKTCAKLAAAGIGNTYALGYRHSPEMRQRMSEAAKERWARKRQQSV
jgi:hypothetical protein